MDIRYAQCWEDADILVEALAIEPQHRCLAIASAGDNALALLTRSPQAVVALDLNPAQVACLELRVAAYRTLADDELLRFLGAHPATDRAQLYRRCRPALSEVAREFWDARPAAIADGIFSAGKFERYFAIFRRHVLPLIHSRATVAELLAPKSACERAEFFERRWNTWPWQTLFRLFFSRAVMRRLGRDPRFFAYAEGDLAGHLLARVRHALVELDPSQNPYLHWILTGTYGEVLPLSLRAEHLPTIRRNLDRLSWQTCSLEDFLERDGAPFDRFALSDVFEYVSRERYAGMLAAIVAHSTPDARLAYWNMLAPRMRPESLAGVLASDGARAQRLHALDKTFFYSRFVIEHVR
jgi:S-adenosylmethionine-diacylglycerol 3-amino-3-carboxypropyl transferase